MTIPKNKILMIQRDITANSAGVPPADPLFPPKDLPITATPLFPALPTGFVVDGSPRGLPRAPRELYEAGEATGRLGAGSVATPRSQKHATRNMMKPY